MDYTETPKQSQAQRRWKIRRYKPIRLLEKILFEEEKLARELNAKLGRNIRIEPPRGTPQLQGIERDLKRRAYRPRKLFPSEAAGPGSASPAGYGTPSPRRRTPLPAQYQYSPEQYEPSPGQCQCSPVQYQGSPVQYQGYPSQYASPEYDASPDYQDEYADYDQCPYAQAGACSLPLNRSSPLSPAYGCSQCQCAPQQSYQPEEESPVYDHYVQSPEFDEYVPSPGAQAECMHYQGDPYKTPDQYHQFESPDGYPGGEEQGRGLDALDDFENFKTTVMAALKEEQESYASLMHFLNTEEDLQKFHDFFLEHKENKKREQGRL